MVAIGGRPGRTSSRHRTRPHAAARSRRAHESAPTSPVRNRRTSLLPSRRSVLMRWPGRRRVKAGAIPQHHEGGHRLIGTGDSGFIAGHHRPLPLQSLEQARDASRFVRHLSQLGLRPPAAEYPSTIRRLLSSSATCGVTGLGCLVALFLLRTHPGRPNRVHDRGDERLIVEGTRVIGLRVEEDWVLGTGVATKLRPEGLALALEQLALGRVELNRPTTWLLPRRHPGLRGAELRAPARPPTRKRTRRLRG